jgi:hypothetical protein
LSQQVSSDLDRMVDQLVIVFGAIEAEAEQLRAGTRRGRHPPVAVGIADRCAISSSQGRSWWPTGQTKRLGPLKNARVVSR